MNVDHGMDMDFVICPSRDETFEFEFLDMLSTNLFPARYEVFLWFFPIPHA